MGKVRIYDLAKELKLESKKVLEDARRLGVDVSVPSNTLDDNIAAKIRENYYPKKEPAAVPRAARLIKHPTPAPAPVPAPAPAHAQAPAAPPSVEHSQTPQTVKKPAPDSVKAEQSQTTITQLPHPRPHPAQPQPTVSKSSPAVKTDSLAAETKHKEISSESSKARVVKLQRPAPAVVSAETASAPAPDPVSAPAPTPEKQDSVAAKVIAKPASAEHPIVAEHQLEQTPSAQLPPVVAKASPRGIQTAVQQPEVKAKPSFIKPGPGSEGKFSGTKVIKLTPPSKPMPKPQPKTAPLPAQKAGGKNAQEVPSRPPVRENQRPRELQRDPRDKGVHILPSGAQQRTVYIPPKDQRPKGRHQPRKEKDKQKEEGQQKLLPRRQMSAAPVARAVPAELKSVRLVEGSTVREFAERIEAKPRDVVTILMQRGVMATINQTIGQDIAREIGIDYGFEVSFGDFEDMIIESEFQITPEVMEDTDPRAPVITVMGHVDHGKTSLLDAIRAARVAEGEAGGITQHIGAYSVEVPDPDNSATMRRVVFLDTPGHEAFTMMRARGAKVTDIVVLVVAADDGVMPQTVEAIEHAKAAGVPIVVAINKVDKPDANPERVKKELADRGLLWDGWGGQTTMVEVSAKKKQNIEGLLEMILLTADILDLKANPKRMATGTVLEAKLDRGRGAVATVLIQNGTLHLTEPLIVGNYFGKVRALMNDRGERVASAGPASPVEVLGLEGVPSAGDQFQVVDDVSKAQQISQFRQSLARASALARSAARGLDQLAVQMATGEVKELLVILKADVQGSVEVLKDTLSKLSTERVKVRIIRSGVGAITESDVLLASASNATETGAATVIIGFNVRPESRADEVARQEDVDIRLHSIIYKVEEEIRNAMLGLLDATLKEVIIGEAKIRDIIRVPKVGSVAGCIVASGSIKRGAHARLIRDNVVIFESHIASLRRFKDDVSEVQQGFECGMTIERFNDYKIDDIIEAYLTEKVAPTKL
ncbi:MAG: translation initiation factor IF-2 [Acidobacteria bacterium]|nr:translation initiation factor IF-2 [Acidobacteriota bacterium]